MQLLTLDTNARIRVINSGTTVYEITFNYNYTRQGWFIDVIAEDGSFFLYGIRVTSLYNLLHTYSDKLGFGIAVSCEKHGEPFFYEDFITGRAQVYLLEPFDLEAQANLLEMI